MSAGNGRLDDLMGQMVAGAVHDVPDGSSWDDVHRWLHHLDPLRNGQVSVAEAQRGLAGLGWLRLAATEAFWADEPDRLSQATAGLLGALWQMGQPCALHASGGADGLALRLGVAQRALPALSRLLSAFLPGSSAEPLAASGHPVPWAEPGDRAVATLWGPPPTSPEADSVLSRLAGQGGARWSLCSLLVPVPRSELDERSAAVSALAAQIAIAAQRQIVLDDLVTATVDDPEAARLLEGVATEQDRIATAVRSGAWAVVTWIEAPALDDLAAAIGAAASAPTLRSGPDPGGSASQHVGGWTPTLGTFASPALLSGGSAGELIRPPADDRLGLPSRRWVALDRHPEPLPRVRGAVTLGLTDDGAPLELPLESLTSHLLITGSPGSGKTTASTSLLVQLTEQGVPITVIEPVKQEYAGLPIEGVLTWRPAAPEPGLSWILNPLEVPPGVSVQNHIERIVALIRSTFSLIAPLPFLIELGMQRVYENRGWDVTEDRAPASRVSGWPTISELIEVCAQLPAELGYAAEIRANLRAAIEARLGALTRGPRSRILDRDGVFPMDGLLSSRVVVNLDDFGDDEARAFFMGLILVRIRESCRGHSDGRLRHVLLLEEAHRLLPAGSAGGTDGAEASVGAGGHAAGEIANLLAEIRASGEGIVVVDQSPSNLVPAVLANTSTKVALRADARRDQEALAAAMGLADRDAHVLGGLRRHEALITWEGMDRPIRTRLHHQRMMLASRDETPQRRPARRLAAPSAPVQAAVRTLARTSGDDAHAAQQVLAQLVRGALDSARGPLIDEAVAELVAAEVELLGRARRWDASTRAAAVQAVLSRTDTTAHPSRLLIDGRQPLPACRVACPAGGCLVGEPARTEALHLLAEGPSTLVRLAADPEERRRRIARRALAVTGEDAPEHLQHLAATCVTARVFDDWADPATVAGLLPRPVSPAEPSPGRIDDRGR